MDHNSTIVKFDPTRPVKAKRKGQTTFDRLWNFYNDSKHRHRLTKKQEEQRQIVEDGWKFWGTEYTKRSAKEKLMQTHGMSLRSADKYMKWVEKIFGNPNTQIKTARKNLHIERLERLMKKAEEDERWMDLEALSKQYIKITGMENSDDMTAEDLARAFTGHQIVFSADPEVLKQQAASMVPDGEYTEYEDVTNGQP